MLAPLDAAVEEVTTVKNTLEVLQKKVKYRIM
jgi:hypothetical protein